MPRAAVASNKTTPQNGSGARGAAADAGPAGRWLTDAERRARSAKAADKHDEYTRRGVARFREPTGDDDQAFAERLTRMRVPREWAR